ncbi:hypothetical protein REJC140_00500 [Pseudorhizobium endolithicum]|uniref:Uncharacterized protein n=1 Tax=Pseudorhizobium endolithicum TaxID=1191678 RepID=A0ABN7JDF9_9HYPH|nr:hypothetical protein [Pseudorhizobium endolithicum]CAD7024615.1 hypothetical protein REJC140_00500 [Pseudorhizobium endolithicum]
MAVPTVADDARKPEVAAWLTVWARRYTRCEAVASRIARRTILVASTNPDVLDGPDIKRDLLVLLHALALEEIGAAHRPREEPGHPDEVAQSGRGSGRCQS